MLGNGELGLVRQRDATRPRSGAASDSKRLS
jgi:hypothetical protein